MCVEMKEANDDLQPGQMNSEHESAAGRTPAREKNRTETDPADTGGTDAGKKPADLRTTSKTDLEHHIEEKDGRLAQRTPEEMSLHEELDQRKKEDE